MDDHKNRLIKLFNEKLKELGVSVLKVTGKGSNCLYAVAKKNTSFYKISLVKCVCKECEDDSDSYIKDLIEINTVGNKKKAVDWINKQ